MKGQAILMSAMILIMVFTIIELDIFNFLQNPTLDKDYNLHYFEKLKKEITLALTNENSVENFLDFLLLIKQDAALKNYNFSLFSVIATNDTNKLNVSVLNYLDTNINVTLKINTTPHQIQNILLMKGECYNFTFDIESDSDYELEINYTENITIPIIFREKNNIFAFIDVFLQNENIRYIDKFRKSYYFS
ncbi:MAG: hypothetical protein QXO84_00795 [Candidatus Aenigmatarchaeota archaeon]